MADAALAVGCFAAVTLPVALGVRAGEGSTPAVVAFGAAAAAPLTLRRGQPLAVLAAVTAALTLAALAGVRFTPFVSNAGPVLAIVVATLADRRPRRTSLLATGTALLATVAAAGLSMRLHPEQDQDYVQLLIAVPAWLLGDTLRTRREYLDRLAAEGRRKSAERERRIRAEERLRVSRDVHDVVSHTLSMIAVRSGAARLLLDDQPAEARAALAVIETTSRAALDEVRRVLRTTREAPPRERASEAQPTLADLDRLIAGLRHDGLEVSQHVTGDVRRHPDVLATSAYRIVQEALTNVVRHAAAGHAWVEVHHGARDLVIRVVDDGHGPRIPVPPGVGPGLGLIGMRERAELFGGEFTAGPGPAGGFAVTVRLPTDGGLGAIGAIGAIDAIGGGALGDAAAAARGDPDGGPDADTRTGRGVAADGDAASAGDPHPDGD